MEGQKSKVPTLSEKSLAQNSPSGNYQREYLSKSGKTVRLSGWRQAVSLRRGKGR
jgi:hypothetical protein